MSRQGLLPGFEPTHVALTSARYQRSGRPPCLYVMTSDDGRHAKVGACHHAGNVDKRCREVNRHQRKRGSGFPVRVAVIAELDGMALGADDETFDRRWAEVECIESAVRFTMTRRLGALSHWYEWLDLTDPVTDAEWAAHIAAAFHQVDRLSI